MVALHASAEWTITNALDVLWRAALYFSAYIYSFCLDNQLTGYEEDRLNKPDRALPSGLLTLDEAARRRTRMLIAFPALGLALGGLPLLGWALAWEAVFLAYNHLGLDRHFLGKNLVFITLGAVAQLAAAWQLAAPIDATGWRWIVVISLGFGATLDLQDLRDVAGDRKLGRVTLPIAIGDAPARWLVAMLIAALPLLTHVGLTRGLPVTLGSAIAEGMLALLNLVVASRVLLMRSQGADHTTYMLHTGWFCAALGSGLVLL